MIDNDKKIRKGLPPKREPESYQTLNDIVIPAGTILRGVGIPVDGEHEYAAKVCFSGVAGIFSVTVKPGTQLPAGSLKRVIAS